jgi:hypothetical protein
MTNKPISANLDLSAPRHLTSEEVSVLARSCRETSLASLCANMGFAPRVTGGSMPRIYLTKLAGHFRGPGKYFVGTKTIKRGELPIRVLETLAYSFNDYATRETIRGRGLFVARPAPGRPRQGPARSAAEKVRRWRAVRA